MATTENLGLELNSTASSVPSAIVTNFNTNMNKIDEAVGQTGFYDVDLTETSINLEGSALTAFRVGNVMYVNGALIPKLSGGFVDAGRIIDVRLNDQLGDVQFPIAGYGGYGEGILFTSGDDIVIKVAFPSANGSTAYRLNFTVPVK